MGKNLDYQQLYGHINKVITKKLKHESHEYSPLSKHGDSSGVAANLIILNHVCQAFLHG